MWSEGQNWFDFPYDWRRDNRVAARHLAERAPAWLHAWRKQSGNKDAKLVLVGHSMGGLVARHYLEVLGGWRDARMLVTFGTPYRGSLNALDFLCNGFKKRDRTAGTRSDQVVALTHLGVPVAASIPRRRHRFGHARPRRRNLRPAGSRSGTRRGGAELPSRHRRRRSRTDRPVATRSIRSSASCNPRASQRAFTGGR